MAEVARLRRDRPDARVGFTLAELMIVVIIMMVILQFAIPRYTTATEQARVDLAGSNLVALYTAQRLYFVDQGTFATTLTALIDSKLLDASFAPGKGLDSKYTYAIDSASATAFVGSATRTAERWVGTLRIDQTGTLTGQIDDGLGNPPILTPSRFALGM